jgi:hypothetical protein
MATTTPNFGWSVPTSTDLVKDGATAIETLGDSIDASFLDLKGGTTGQVLSKASNTDLDYTWVTTDDANAIQNAIVDAKGDLIAATAADTPARLAVGTNGYRLTADSTAATGLAWKEEGVSWVSTTSFTAATSVSVNNCFVAANTTYMVQFYGTLCTSTKMFMRLSGTDATGFSYTNAAIANSGTAGVTVTGSAAASLNTGWPVFAQLNTTGINSGTVMITNAAATINTTFNSLPSYTEASGPTRGLTISSGIHTVATAYDGFTISWTNSSTGWVKVYAMRTA